MLENIQESNNDDLTNTALAADRYGLSNRAVAAVINGLQMDIGRVSSGKTKLLVDPKKVWRERSYSLAWSAVGEGGGALPPASRPKKTSPQDAKPSTFFKTPSRHFKKEAQPSETGPVWRWGWRPSAGRPGEDRR